ncbi:YkgJ family cysteine cluster protein [Halopseudomonas salina]|uniref:Zinc/iron-chelating domain-containing protein n=1 Tax=Halopseudomonas salina TaxID=1323744 RepID=A0ABQ1PUL8_9GAMM|nr:YkgJ family cysteine cluster protein [Halopseudomonas salina]GGD03510.1 zinc/iron-chelating domain-containing protein [Halopseudomonas salina]
MNTPSPCLNCGACCATFRVSFYWGETDATEGGLVPGHLTEQISPHLSCMQGTNQPIPRCTALLGTVGEGVRCNIYEQRSSSCREFAWHGEDGQPNADCQRARARHGLPPLPFMPLEPQLVPTLIPIVAA